MQDNYTPAQLIENKAAVPEQFDKIAHRYDLATFFSQGYLKDLQRSVQQMDLKGSERVLDLCCGTGKSTLACLQAVPDGEVIGIDNSAEMLVQAEKNFSAEIASGKLTFKKEDVMHLDYPDNSIDAIFMAYGIRNMPEYEKCLKNLLRILKPGGVICFHEYALADRFTDRLYWKFLGYCIILPFSTILTGSSNIFSYLIKSVLNFPAPKIFLALLEYVGFENCKRVPQASWRRPILHSFVAHKSKTA